MNLLLIPGESDKSFNWKIIIVNHWIGIGTGANYQISKNDLCEQMQRERYNCPH